MKCGQLISLEGVEGAGKSTAREFIFQYLSNRLAPIEILLTREPGGTPLAEEIRKVLLQQHGGTDMSAMTELLLIFACRAEHLQHCIRPALQLGKWVVSDRYIDASYAYQAGGRQLAQSIVHTLDQWVVGDNYPALTLLFDVSPHVGLARTAQRGTGKDRIEQEHINFFERVREVYLARAQADPERIKVIDANKTTEHVNQQLAMILDTFMSKHK